MGPRFCDPGSIRTNAYDESGHQQSVREPVVPMKYLQPSFTVPAAPEKVTACEKCAYGTGDHADWCEEWQVSKKLDAIDAILAEAHA